MTSITETPHAEDFAAELIDLIRHYRQRGLSDDWMIEILKGAIEAENGGMTKEDYDAAFGWGGQDL